MNRLLVTGASGFIGQRCLKAIDRRSFEVIAVSRSEERWEAAPGTQWVTADLLNPADVNRLLAAAEATHLLHLAWIATPGAYWESPLNADWARASIDLVNGFARHGGRRVVAAGSCAEYDWSYGRCVEGETPLAPHGFYGICKNAYREILFGLAPKIGLSAAWGRIFFAYGHGEPREKLVSSCASALLEGKRFELRGNPNRAVDFVYVDDLAAMFARLLAVDSSGEFNLGSGRATTLGKLARTVGKVLQRQDLVAQANGMPQSDEPPLSADLAKLKAATGYSVAYDLETGVRATIAAL